MRKGVRIFGWIAVGLVSVIVLSAVWWRTASIRVDPSTLDYLHAYATPTGIDLVGAWEPPGGMVLDRAEYRQAAGGIVVTLYSRPIANLRGETSRLFRVRVPIRLAEPVPTSVVIDGRRGNAPLAVEAPPDARDVLPRVEVEAVDVGG